MHSKDPLEEIAGSWRRSGESAGHSSRASPPHFSLRICFRLDIGRCVRACHLSRSTLRIAGIFFILAPKIPALVVIGNILDHLERIGLMRWREPGHLHVEFPFIQCERALQDSVGDWAGHAAAVLAALHHHSNDILRIFKGREAGEPCGGILMSVHSGLRGAGFPRYHPFFQTCSATGAAVFINDLPKAIANCKGETSVYP